MSERGPTASQGSVPTSFRRIKSIMMTELQTTNLLQSFVTKYFENWSAFNEVMGNSIVTHSVKLTAANG